MKRIQEAIAGKLEKFIVFMLGTLKLAALDRSRAWSPRPEI